MPKGMPKAYSDRITDKKRLDWLEQHPRYELWHLDTQWDCWNDPHVANFGNTPRQAIDAAMRAEKKGGNRER